MVISRRDLELSERIAEVANVTEHLPTPDEDNPIPDGLIEKLTPKLLSR